MRILWKRVDNHEDTLTVKGSRVTVKTCMRQSRNIK